MEQHPVPQNITTFQFRLIGDMTVKQFGYLAAGAILGYICYKMPLPVFFTIPIAVAVFLLGFGLAFVPIEERPMDVWFMSFLKSIYAPTFYVWQKEKPALSTGQSIKTIKTTAAVPVPAITPPIVNTVVPTTFPVKNEAETPVLSQQFINPKPEAAPQEEPAPAPAGPIGLKEDKSNAVLNGLFKAPDKAVQSGVAAGPPPAPVSKETKVAQKSFWQGLYEYFVGLTKNIYHKKPTVKAHMPAPAPVVAPVRVLTRKTQNMGTLGWFRQILNLMTPAKTPSPSQTVIPQTKSGFDPQLEAVKKSGPSHVAGSKMPTTAPAEVKSQPQAELEAQKQIMQEAQVKTNKLEEKLVQLQKELEGKTHTETRIEELQKQLTEALGARGKLEDEMRKMRDQLSKMKSAPEAPSVMAKPKNTDAPTVRVITADTAVRAGLPKLTAFPNVVTGIIKDSDSNLLPGVLVTVRDKDGIPLRALKTNRLGQFAASTPLGNGTYLIEVEDPRNRYVFDRIQISLNGSVVPAVEVVAKSQKEISRDKLAKEIFGNQTD